MTIEEFQVFLNYFSKVRKRTIRVVSYIPAEQLEWSYKPGKFSLGDLVRHLGAIERHMYAENAQFKPNLYKGCGKELAEGYEAVLQFLDTCHQESMEIFSALTETDINAKTQTPVGTPITLWKWLRLMVEHEIHHRGQIYTYLGMLDIATPPIYGLTAEELVALSAKT